MSGEMPECGIGTKKLMKMHKCINELRIRNIYCDVTIKLKEQILKAHGGVLCAHSSYFRERLKDMKGEKVIEITELEPEVIQNCIEYMYTGDIKVTLDNVESIAQAIKLFGLTEISGICEKSLEKDLETYNAMDIRRIAIRYGWNELVKNTQLYMRANAIQILIGHSFVLYTKEEFMWFLKNKFLDHPLEEMQVWHSVIKWTSYELPEREADLFDVLQLVTLENLSVAFMNDSIRREQLVMRSQECMKYLLQHLFSRLTTNGANEVESSHWPDLG